MTKFITFPNDLIPNMLSFLPLKSVTRFKSVSKTWCSLIQTPEFIHILNQRLKQAQFSNEQVIIKRGQNLYVVERNKDKTIFRQLPNLPFANHHGFRLLGSCNGVVCLQYQIFCHIILCNPSSASGYYVELEFDQFMSPHPLLFNDDGYGFGYDTLCDDYKVVRLFHEGNNPLSMRLFASVRSLKSNQWRNRVDECSRMIKAGSGNNGVLVNDSLHWSTIDNVIIAFNVVTERFHEIPQPSSLKEGGEPLIRVGVLQSCLSLYSFDSSKGCHEIFMMMSYGVQDSWRRIKVMASGFVRKSWNLEPVGYVKTGYKKIFLREIGGLLFDLDDYSVERFNDVEAASIYVETLEFNELEGAKRVVVTNNVIVEDDDAEGVENDSGSDYMSDYSDDDDEPEYNFENMILFP